MSERYNFYNLEALFKQYLVAGIVESQTNAENITNKPDYKEKKLLKKISVKNYLSDLRHFLGWLVFYLKSHHSSLFNKSFQTPFESQIEMLKLIDDKIIDEYKTYLNKNNIPIKTINRRLSTLRKFFSFCISQGWLRENPAKKIENLKLEIKNDDWELQKKSILNQFQSDLLKENIPQKTVNSYLKDIEEFFTVV